MPRRTWQFVDTARHYDDTGAHANILTGEQDGDWLSGKLRYRDDSPFADWLRSQTQDERFDALCVTAIDDTDRTNRQVQADGQIKSGARGQHGTKDRAQVIGFVNETYLNALAAQVDAARNALSQADTDYTAAKTQSDNLHRELELANQLAYTSWERIDIAGAQRTITDTQDAIASIKNDPKLAELAKQRDELNAELDRVERQRIESDQAAARAGSAVEAALIWLRDHADTGTTDAAGATADNDDDAASGPLPDEVTAALAESYDNRFAGLADAAMRAHMIIGAGAAGTQAPGESFPERTIAGIGKDMASRINLLNGQADAARTGVESKMSTYIALYAADDDSLTASVEDYRYYLDELASLTQLAAVAATDAEYRRCLEQLLRSFLTIKRAIDTDASDIHDQLDRINAMLKGQQFGPKHGSLSLHADVRRPERTFWAQLIRVIGTLNDWKSADVNDSDASRKAFAACAPMVGLLRAELAQVKDANGVKATAPATSTRAAARPSTPSCIMPTARMNASPPPAAVRAALAGAHLIRIRRGAHLPARRRPDQRALVHHAVPRRGAHQGRRPLHAARPHGAAAPRIPGHRLRPGKQDRRNPRGLHQGLRDLQGPRHRPHLPARGRAASE